MSDTETKNPTVDGGFPGLLVGVGEGTERLTVPGAVTVAVAAPPVVRLVMIGGKNPPYCGLGVEWPPAAAVRLTPSESAGKIANVWAPHDKPVTAFENALLPGAAIRYAAPSSE